MPTGQQDSTPPPSPLGEEEYSQYKETTEAPADVEEAHPFDEKPTAEEEPQEAREDQD